MAGQRDNARLKVLKDFGEHIPGGTEKREGKRKGKRFQCFGDCSVGWGNFFVGRETYSSLQFLFGICTHYERKKISLPRRPLLAVG